MAADETPHFLALSFVHFLNAHGNVVRIHAPQHRCVDRFDNPFLFFNSLSTVSLLMHNTRRGIADTTAVERHINDLLLYLRQTPMVAVLQEEGLLRAGLVLAHIALFLIAGLATFADLIVSALWAVHRKSCHLHS